ncbi:MAG: P-loop NTPase [Spirochaetales bacterium]|nr:P-loop NTPase [Spirochaetales bacterium]
MNVIVPVASGKGGVGKTVMTANLGVSLARLGKTVIMVDLDLGGANLHTCLGVKNKHAGVGQLINKQADRLESLIVPTGIDRLFFIPGDSLMPGTANLPYFKKRSIIRELSRLTADYTLLDLGSGSSYNTIDFFLTSSIGLIVTTPETTAVLNAYSFLKTALYRLLYRSFPPRSEERKLITDFVSQKIEGTDTSFRKLIMDLYALKPESGKTAEQKLETFFPKVILNMGSARNDIAVGSKLRQIVRRNLDIELEYIGFVQKHDQISQSIIRRQPLVLMEPGSSFATAVGQVARRIAAKPVPDIPVLYEDDEDLNKLESDYLDQEA